MGKSSKLKALRKQFRVDGQEVANKEKTSLGVVAKGIMSLAKKRNNQEVDLIAQAVKHFYKSEIKK